jgi:hypothetical protein
VRRGRVLAGSRHPLVRRWNARRPGCLRSGSDPGARQCSTRPAAGSGASSHSANPPPDRRLRRIGERGPRPRVRRLRPTPPPTHARASDVAFARTGRGATTSSGRPSRSPALKESHVCFSALAARADCSSRAPIRRGAAIHGGEAASRSTRRRLHDRKGNTQAIARRLGGRKVTRLVVSDSD